MAENREQTDGESNIRLIALPHLGLDRGRIDRLVPEGGTVADHVRALGWHPETLSARAFIDGEYIEQARWEYAVPKAGQFLSLRVIPMGGGGGGGGKDALRIVAMLGVVVLSIFTAGGGLAAAAGLFSSGAFAAVTGAGLGVGGIGSLVAGAAVSLAGSLAVNALIPPAQSKMQDLSQLNLSPTLSLTGSANQLAPYAPIPRVYGRHKIFPPLAARTYTEVVGSDHYLRVLLCCGYGPLALSELKIGQTPLEQFQDVELEIRYGFPDDAPMTLIPSAVLEDNLSILLSSASGWLQRTSQRDATELSVDVVFPAGLGDFRPPHDQGYLVTIAVEYRLVGTDDWIVVDSQVATAATVTTAFDGADNDLVFTARHTGSEGNALMVWVMEAAALAVEVYPPFLFVSLVSGVTTALEVLAAVQAHAGASDLVDVALAPGNDGTGTIDLASVNVYYQLAGGRNQLPLFAVEALTAASLRVSRRWIVPQGQYEIRLKKLAVDNPSGLVRDQVYWTTLRTIQPGQAVTKTGLCLIAMRIRATDQLTGQIDQFNCVAESILPDWTGSGWVSRPTSNPASIYRNLLQGSANARPLGDSRIDLTTLAVFHARCAAAGYQFNAVIDYRTTVFELARDVLAAGLGSLHLRDGTYSVVEDLPQTVPVQLFTPRNSWGYRGQKTFTRVPHALKARFVNPDKDWQQDERYVYADGYSEANATEFEAFELTGVTDSEQAWKMARYHQAVATLRPETHELTCDIEHLVCTRGDLVLVQQDVPLFGLVSGRITAVTTDAVGRTTAITLDEPCVMQAGERYGIRLRTRDGSYLQREVQNVPGAQTTLTLLSPI